jgi:translation initiation factor IF-2
VNQALAGGEGGRQRSLAAMKRKQERQRQKAMGGSQDREKVVRDVQVPETIVVSELANRMAERVADVVKALMKNGMMVTQNQSIDADTAELIVEEFGHRVQRVSDADVEDVIETAEDKEEDLQPRPPGHHDHGPCRPRQDLASRQDPPGQCRLGRGRRHHPAYRRLPGEDRLAARC